MTAQTYSQRPSTLVGIPEDNPWLAYVFDRSVTIFGRWVENMLSERDKHGKSVYKLKEILNNPELQPGKKKKQSSPQQIMAAFGRRNVRIKP